MSSNKSSISQALELSALERAGMIEELLASLDMPDAGIDAVWATEAGARVAAYNRGDMETVSASDVFAKFRRS